MPHTMPYETHSSCPIPSTFHTFLENAYFRFPKGMACINEANIFNWCKRLILWGLVSSKNFLPSEWRNDLFWLDPTKGHFTHETESPWPLHFKHCHWWKRWSQSKFASHYAWGTNGVCECKMDVKSTWIPTWHQMDHVSWSLGLFSKTTSWR